VAFIHGKASVMTVPDRADHWMVVLGFCSNMLNQVKLEPLGALRIYMGSLVLLLCCALPYQWQHCQQQPAAAAAAA
jgi:hypothetical protein